MKAASPAKYLMVRDQLAHAIKAGEFDETRRLPSERELAESFNISRMTARRAVEALEEAELIVRRGGSGSYVRDSTQERLISTTVHQICMAYEGSMVQDFLRIGGHHIEQRGWNSHIVRVQTGYERAALQALASGEPAIVWVNDTELAGPMGPALEEAHDRTVLVGNYTENSQVRCVLADDAMAVEIAVRHLQKSGHHKIGFVCGLHPSHNEALQLAAWRELMSHIEASDDLVVAAEITPITGPTEAAYNAVCLHLHREKDEESAPTTAFITTSDAIAVGVSAACEDHGRPVAEQTSLINLQDSPLLKFARPPVSCIEINFSAQISTAFEILEADVAGRTTHYKERVVRLKPHLIERSTVVRPALKV